MVSVPLWRCRRGYYIELDRHVFRLSKMVMRDGDLMEFNRELSSAHEFKRKELAAFLWESRKKINMSIKG